MTTRALLVLVLLGTNCAIVFGTLAVLLEELPVLPFWISLTVVLACGFGATLVCWEQRQRRKRKDDHLASLQGMVRSN